MQQLLGDRIESSYRTTKIAVESNTRVPRRDVSFLFFIFRIDGSNTLLLIVTGGEKREREIDKKTRNVSKLEVSQL